MKKKLLIALFAVMIILGLICCFVNMQKKAEEKAIQEQIEQIETKEEEIFSGTEEGEEALEQGFLEEPEDLIFGATRTAQDDGFNLGPKQESIVYFSQTDSRWKNIIYSNHNDPSQTIGSSGCGPTSAAMVVSGIKGLVYPDQMADLYVRYGYRSYSDGTYFAAFQFTADYFGLEFSRAWNVNDAIEKVKNNNYVVASCGRGLFTTGGHFIVIWKFDDINNNGVIDNNDILHVYDPYLYNGKFNTANRAGKVTLAGNDVQLTVYNFKTYANSGAWFCYPHTNIPTPTPTPEPQPTPTPEPTPTPSTETTYTVQKGDCLSSIANKFGVKWQDIATLNNIPGPNYVIYPGQVLKIPTNSTTPTTTTGTVKVRTSLNVRRGPGTNYSYVRSLYNGDKVTIYEEQNGWYRIGNNEWVISTYVVKDSISPTRPSTVGQYKYFRVTYTYIYSNSNLSGTKYYYLANTKVKILQNVSDTVDYIYVPKTGRYGYVSTTVYK